MLGLLFTLMTERFTTDPSLRTSLTVGFLGAYTTFSTLTLETYRLLEDGALVSAAGNLLGSCAAGMLAIYLGIVLGRVL